MSVEFKNIFKLCYYSLKYLRSINSTINQMDFWNNLISYILNIIILGSYCSFAVTILLPFDVYSGNMLRCNKLYVNFYSCHTICLTTYAATNEFFSYTIYRPFILFKPQRSYYDFKNHIPFVMSNCRSDEM